ncbi:LemA protein [Caldicoprobacter guelmensis]|uniref:LemA family protein n=1 Tax=Caldicoprobacter guelmensis TaxID=1170224 RepID=UPI00195939AD|nr:LemA family protein [Caldicoprobacter guelmensis]MBM7582573.1 LemA protein [Caldicoprobacter guelmensis]
MKNWVKAVLIIGIILVLIAVWMINGYNNLVAKSEEVQTALSQIDNQLQRRNDLIPNLVETVKRYAAHESEVFAQIAEARAKLAGAATVQDMAQADAQVSSALSRLLAIAENYPELKANQNFIQLQDELAGTENRITVARRDYNEKARDYNTTIRRFPMNIVASIFGFERAEYFEASEDAKQVPNVGKLFED